MLRFVCALLATVKKEFAAISRDRAGLLVLFLMPAALVVIVALVQNNIMKLTGVGTINALYVDMDGGEGARELKRLLTGDGTLALADEKLSPDQAREAVKAGRYRFMLLVPEGFSKNLDEGAARLAKNGFRVPDPEGKPLAEPPREKPKTLELYFDPGVQGTFRSAISSAVREAALAIEIDFKARAYAGAFKTGLHEALQKVMGPIPPDRLAEFPEFVWRDDRLVAVGEGATGGKIPTSVQQNVPAWTLFGMFFIVVPLSGAIVRERSEGLIKRIMGTPAPLTAFVTGKVLAFSLVNALQCLLMLAIGMYFLPSLGLPALELGPHKGLLALVALSASLAATGYGLLLGSLARTFEQASMFGAVSVVIAAAVGGVMVPDFAMPQTLQTLSGFSPLNWGLRSFLDLILREEPSQAIYVRIWLLVSMSVVCILLSRASLSRRG